MTLAAGCGLAYQAATEHRASKMEQELKPGLTMAQVRQMFGQPDIVQQQPDDDSKEVWSYAKHANSNDVAAEVFYTSAKEGDKGTFEDLQFIDGNLASWSEAQHTMAPKEMGHITTTLSYGRGGGGRHSAQGQNPSSNPSAGSEDEPNPPSSSPNNPFSVTF